MAIADAVNKDLDPFMRLSNEGAMAAARSALDYLKQPAPASKLLFEGQGPELTIEQIRAMEKLP